MSLLSFTCAVRFVSSGESYSEKSATANQQ